MADKKISALTAASTPLAGSEVLPIVQGGSTVKVSVDNLTAGKAVTMSGLTVGTYSTASTVTGLIAAAASNDAELKLMEAASSYGFTLRNVGGSGLNIIRHNGSVAGDSAIFVRRDVGYVSLGSASTPAYQLTLSLDSAAKPSTNTWTIASDARLKNVTGEYTKGLAAVCALRPITYTYNGNAGFVVDGKENVSIIAQEAVETFPECVGTFEAKLNADDAETTELYNWNGHALTFALVNAIKELKAENDALLARVSALEAAK